MPLKAELYKALIGLYLLSSSSLSLAAEDEETEIEMPDLQFLEFLGQFETDQGEWIEPSELVSESFGSLLDAAALEETESNGPDAAVNDNN